MVKKALIFIVALYAISIALHSCRPCGYYTAYHEFYDLRIFIIDFEQGGMVFDEDMDIPIAKADLGLQTVVWGRFAFLRPRPPEPRGVISEAQAMWSCRHPTAFVHCLTSIAIIARSENSEGHQVEIDVTHSFKVMFGLRRWQEETDDIVWEIKEVISIDEYIYRFPYTGAGASHTIFILNNDDIDLTGRQIFEMIFTFDDGVVLTQKTEELTLI